MKALVCEMCGSQDLVKQDGVYVCQNCGTKYSVEEARKLMVEGTVKVDNTDKLANLYQVARRARDNNDSEGAAKYYDLIQIEDPTSWEASFYSTYFKAMSCKIGEIRSAANSVSNCLDTVMGLIKEYVADKAEQKAAVKEVVARCITISELLKTAALNHYNGISPSIQRQYQDECYGRTDAAGQMLFICGDAVERTFHDEPDLATFAADAWRAGINYGSLWLSDGSYKTTKYMEKLKTYDASGYASVRIPQLKSTVAQAQQLLAKTPEKAKFSKIALIVGGFLSFIGLTTLFFGMKDTTNTLLGILYTTIGLVILFLGRPSKKKGEQYKATRERAQREIEEAEKELAELEK